MHRMICLGIGVAITSAAGTSALGVSAIPIGPEGPSHYPVEVNNEGDVLFRVWTWWEPTYDEDKPAEQAEVIRADGTAIRIDDREWYDIYASALGPNGEFVVGLGWLDYENELPGGGVPVQFEPELVKPDGSRVRIDRVDHINQVYGFAPDGRALGWAQATRDLTDDLPVTPFVWDEESGVTLLALPAAATRGWAVGGDLQGHYVGFANDGISGSVRKAVWWNADGTIASSFDMDLVHAIAHDRFAQAGVLADGSVLGFDRDSNLDGTTVLTISPNAEVTTIPIDPGLGLEILDANTNGLMVGRRYREGEYYITADWMIWGLDGIGFPLDRFMPSELDLYISQVIDINDRGDVLVLTSDRATYTVQQAYLITGIPAPGAASVGALGLAWAGIRRRR